jgi:hypothetical protein
MTQFLVKKFLMTDLVFRHDRSGMTSSKQSGGGVVVAVSKKISVSEIDVIHNETLECMVEIKFYGYKFVCMQNLFSTRY